MSKLRFIRGGFVEQNSIAPLKVTQPLYRREKRQDQTYVVKIPILTRRSPSFVPYLVDNLWEWRRPEHLPNRRHAVFANTDCDAIQVSGSCFNIQMFGICKGQMDS